MVWPSNKDRERTGTVLLSLVGRLSIPCCNFLYSSPGRGVDELTISFYAALVVELEGTIKEHAGLQIETDDLMLVIRKGMTKGATDALKSQIAGRTAERIADQVADILSTLPSAKVEHVMLTGVGAHLFACEGLECKNFLDKLTRQIN